MTIPNQDTLLSGIELNRAANPEASFDPIGTSIGAVEAVIADVGTSFYNLAAFVSPLPTVNEDKVLGMMADMGLNDAVTFTKNHPDAVHIAGLIAGGWNIGNLGAKLAMKALGRGEILATDSGKMISRTMARKQQAAQVAEEAGPASEAYRQAIRNYKKSERTDAFIAGAGNIGLADLAMSQSFALQDADIKDYALSMAIGGAANVGVTAVARALTTSKSLTSHIAQQDADLVLDNTASIPVQLKNSLGEATYLHAQDTMTEQLISKTPDMPERQIAILKQQSRINKTRQIELLDKATHKSLRAVQGASRDNPDAYHFELDLRNNLMRHLDTNASLAGAKRVMPYNKDTHVSFFGDHVQDIAVQHSVLPHDMDRLVARINKMQESGTWIDKGEKSVKLLSRVMGIPEVAVAKTHRIINTAIIDARTGSIHSLEDAQNIATAKDLEIAKVVPDSPDLLPGQVQFNNLDAMTTGNRAVKGSVRISLSDVQKAGVTEALHYKGVIEGGGLNSRLLDQRDSLIETIDNKLFSAIDEMRANGMSNMEISLRTHSDFNKLEEAAAKGIKPKDLGGVLLPTSKQGIAAADQRALAAIEGDAFLGQSTLTKAAALDHNTTRALNTEFVESFVAESESPLIKAQWEFNNSGIAAGIYANLRSLNPALYADNTFASMDMALRHQGGAVDNIVAFGARMLSIIQNRTKELTQPVNVSLERIALDPVARVKWNESEVAIRGTELFGEDAIVAQGKELGVLSGNKFTPLVKADGVTPLGPLPDDVVNFWQNFEQSISTEVRNNINFSRGLLGQNEAVPRGIKLPPKNLTRKEIAYAIDPLTNETTLYYADTAEALEGLVREAKVKFPDRELITKRTDLERFNIIHDHVSTGEMRVADFNKAKGTTTYDAVSADTNQISAFADANAEYLVRLGKRNARLMNPEITNHLKLMHEVTNESTNLYADVEKTAFGGSILARHNNLTKINDAFTGVIDRAIDIWEGNFGSGVRHVWDAAKNKVVPNSNNASLEDEVARVFKEFEDRGYLKDQLPWQNQMEALAQSKAYEKLGDKAGKIIATNNFLVAGLALRFFDLSHSLVTMLSIPITTMPEAMMKAGNYAGMKHMMEGVRRAYHPANRDAMRIIEQHGITKPEVSEANDFLAATVANPSLTDKIENNPVFHVLQKPSEWAEANSRRVAAATAHSIYESAHGVGTGVSGEGLAFISAFVKRTMGNYTTAQRPALFQGTFGAAIGLFQTYVWTMGQMIFRGLEQESKLPLAALLATQSGVFGLRSIPGYDAVNHYIGSHYGNPDNNDVTTHIYEGVGNNRIAEALLYGAPSALLNTAIWTRGVVNPRSPITVDTNTGAVSFAPAAIAPIQTALGMVSDVNDRLSEGASVGDSVLAAIQLQQLSRPFARISDIFAGQSIDQRGGTVDPDTTPKLNLATFARAVGSRPLQEQVVRDLAYQQSFYNSANQYAKSKLMKAVRLNISRGKGQGDALREYLDLGGTMSGFRSALNKVYLEDTQGKIATLDDSRLKMAIEQGIY